MSTRGDKMLSFGGTAAAITVAAVVARVACPGGCTACTTCAQSVVPAVAAATAVGGAFTGSMMIKKRRRTLTERPAGEDEPAGVDQAG